MYEGAVNEKHVRVAFCASQLRCNVGSEWEISDSDEWEGYIYARSRKYWAIRESCKGWESGGESRTSSLRCCFAFSPLRSSRLVAVIRQDEDKTARVMNCIFVTMGIINEQRRWCDSSTRMGVRFVSGIEVSRMERKKWREWSWWDRCGYHLPCPSLYSLLLLLGLPLLLCFLYVAAVMAARPATADNAATTAVVLLPLSCRCSRTFPLNTSCCRTGKRCLLPYPTFVCCKPFPLLTDWGKIFQMKLFEQQI